MTLAGLDRLIGRFSRAAQRSLDDVEQQRATASAWQSAMSGLLARYSTAAYMLGADTPVLSALALSTLGETVGAQLDFLGGFTLAIQEADEFQAGWRARADLYAKSIKTPYWQGRTRLLPLPAMPAQGTQCYTNCGCAWEIVTVDEEAGDYDCYWRRSKDDSCQTCLQREADWSPLRIRGGEVQL